MTSKDKVATWRASLSREERDKQKEKDRARKARKWLELTEEERDKSREKQRLRKATKKKNLEDMKRKEEEEAKAMDDIEKLQMRFDHNHLVNWQNAFDRIQAKFWNQQPMPYNNQQPMPSDNLQPKPYISNPNSYIRNEREHNRKYKVNMRSNQTMAEKEFERIENLLIKRRSRAARSKDQVKIDNMKAKEGMEYEKIVPFKTRRRYKCRDEYLWWRFWNNGEEFRALLRRKLPDYASKFSEWDQKKQNPYIEVDKVDEGLEIDDNKERTPEQLKQLRNERLKRRRMQIREQLNQPIEMPEFEKSEYELMRDRNIAERERMMKEAEEAGLFNTK